jgi:hypothetical protein
VKLAEEEMEVAAWAGEATAVAALVVVATVAAVLAAAATGEEG